jgi:hypothetical protein
MSQSLSQVDRRDLAPLPKQTAEYMSSLCANIAKRGCKRGCLIIPHPGQPLVLEGREG